MDRPMDRPVKRPGRKAEGRPSRRGGTRQGHPDVAQLSRPTPKVGLAKAVC